jgi:hypothetical protein
MNADFQYEFLKETNHWEGLGAGGRQIFSRFMCVTVDGVWIGEGIY